MGNSLTTRYFLPLIAAAFLILAALPSSLKADPLALSFTPYSYPYSEDNQTIGWEFTVGSSPITLSALDWYDRDDKEITGHMVEIWTSTGTPVTGVCVGAGCAGSTYSMSDQYWSTPDQITLQPGTYVIGGEINAGSATSNPDDRGEFLFTNPVTVPDITYLTGIYLPDTPATAFPSGGYELSTGLVGPNFEVDPPAMPEPSSVLLVGIGLLALAAITFGRKRLASSATSN
jgi:hypothetical protein